MKRIKMRIQISVEFSVQCMSLSLETYPVTFRTKIKNWDKNEIERK